MDLRLCKQTNDPYMFILIQFTFYPFQSRSLPFLQNLDDISSFDLLQSFLFLRCSSNFLWPLSTSLWYMKNIFHRHQSMERQVPEWEPSIPFWSTSTWYPYIWYKAYTPRQSRMLDMQSIFPSTQKMVQPGSQRRYDNTTVSSVWMPETYVQYYYLIIVCIYFVHVYR